MKAQAKAGHDINDAHVECAAGAVIDVIYPAIGKVIAKLLGATPALIEKAISTTTAAQAKWAAMRPVESARTIVIGDPLDEATQMSPLVSQAQYDKVMAYMAKAKAEGATLVCGGAARGMAVEPTVLDDVTDEMTLAREEVFGPVMAVLDFDDEAEVLARANATEFGLAAGVFTADLTRAHRVVAALQAGTCWINAYNLTLVEAPFSGVKMSGVGREISRAAVEHYTQIKSVYVGIGPMEAPY